MYYIRWKRPLYDYKIGLKREAPYFIKLNGGYAWGPLSLARGFVSEDAAKNHIIPDARHWLLNIDIIFIHPMNLEYRCKRDA